MLDKTRPEDRQTLRLNISDMSCASCVRRVEKAIAAVPGVSRSSVNLASQSAEIAFDGAPDATAVARAVRDAGYGVGEAVIEFSVAGMTCASCIARVEKGLKSVSGVVDATANLAQEKARVRMIEGSATFDDLAAAVATAGYEAVRPSDTPDAADDEARRNAEQQSLRRSLIVAAVLTAPMVSWI